MRCHHQHHSHFAPTDHRGGRHRAKRGAIRIAIISLLGERPMHGYEIITELDRRSEGRWRPSPGSVYPALETMEAKGILKAEEVDGTRQFSLTASGQERLKSMHDELGEAPAPWKQTGTGGRGELRRLIAELHGQVRQVGKFGSIDQRDAATAILEETKRKLYAVLAEPPAPRDTE